MKTYINPKSLIKTKDVKIGKGTRINGEILIHGKGSVEIGKYCAFGYGIKIISTNHKTSFANQQIFLQRAINGIELEYSKTNKFSVKIGNNVWLGNNVLITSGVKIGNGAVVGAGSVVTKNVKPYSVNVGIPSKKIKFRFNEKVRKFLERIKWWDWSLSKIKKNKHIFNLDLKKIKNSKLNKIKIL